jgi:serine/threonine protein kinase
MWSIGVVLFAMVSGQVPWRSTNRQMIFDEIKSGEYSAPPTASIPCANLISKLIVVKPSQRLTAAQALQHEWFLSSPSIGSVAVSCPLLSLRKVDDFFSPDSEDDAITTPLKACFSASTLRTDHNKVLNEITVREVHTGMASADLRPEFHPMAVSPSMAIYRPTTDLGSAPVATIQSLMQDFGRMQKKKGPRIVRPRVPKPVID